MPDLYIPPENLKFRLKNTVTNYVLYSRKSNEPLFYHYGGGVADDQYWQLVPGTGTYDGYYLIKSKCTGKVIFSRKADPKVSHVEGNGKWADNYFKVEAGSGKHKGHFRLRNYDSATVIFSRTTQSPYLGNLSVNDGVYDDQYWVFELEKMTLHRIEYKTDQAQIIANNTETIGTQTVRNDSDTNQSVDFNFSETKSTSTNFEHIHGFSVGFEVSGEVGIPFVANGEVKVTGSTTHSWTFGETKTESKTISTTFSATAPPHKKVVATATVSRATIEVPYTMYFRSADTGAEVASYGTFHGISYWNISSGVKQSDL